MLSDGIDGAELGAELGRPSRVSSSSSSAGGDGGGSLSVDGGGGGVGASNCGSEMVGSSECNAVGCGQAGETSGLASLLMAVNGEMSALVGADAASVGRGTLATAGGSFTRRCSVQTLCSVQSSRVSQHSATEAGAAVIRIAAGLADAEVAREKSLDLGDSHLGDSRRARTSDAV